MAVAASNECYERNQQVLAAALARVRQALVQHAGHAQAAASAPSPGEDHPMDDKVTALPVPPALETLCSRFGLSAFERDILLLCAGIELDADFAALCAAAQDDAQRNYVTFALALAALPGAHWSALTPAGPLRHWQLIRVEPSRSLVHSPLSIEERVLHYLVGIDYLDERMRDMVHLLPPPEELVPTHQATADHIVTTWVQAAARSELPAVHLRGPETAAKWAIAADACAQLGLDLYRLPSAAIPVAAPDVERLLRLWAREAMLSDCALLIDADAQNAVEAGVESGVARFLTACYGPVILSSRERHAETQKPLVTFDVGKPQCEEQKQIWHAALGVAAADLDGQLERIVGQFDLGAPAIRSAGVAARGHLPGEDKPAPTDAQLFDAVWDACRIHARPQLDDLAQRIEPAATWASLVLPETQREILHEIAVHVRQRRQVYERWGFEAQSARGLGISALFVGPSGTGKTMAAEVLARELRLDLYRVDLSAVVSKYIGETEKNLRRIFDAAEAGCAILLFDEADALFGKRSQVKDSHDRYANIEVSYLLQRMEVYRGLAILTTNMKEALDSAFLRRLRFVVQFPFPDAAQRGEIWQQAFPDRTPTEGLDRAKLARLNIAGGNIRNIAVSAAFLAADSGESVSMRHILRATHREYAKLERTLTDAEIRGWTDK